MWNWHPVTDSTQNNLLRSPAQLCQTMSRTAAVWNQLRCPSDSLQAAAARRRPTVWLHMVWGWKFLPSNHHSTHKTIAFMHQLMTRKRYIEFSRLLRMSVMVSVAVSEVGMTELFLSTMGWRWTASITVMSCCLSRCFQQSNVSQNVVSSQNNNVAYREIGRFLCSVISQGKVVALDRWGGNWNHLSMTHRLTTDCAKNYCNRELIFKVIVENVVTCFLLGHSVHTTLY